MYLSPYRGFVLLFFCCASLALQAQHEIPLNIVVENDIDHSTDKPSYHLVRAEIIQQLSEAGQIYNLVEREQYDAIMSERRGAAQVKDDAYLSSILNGATQMIKLNILDYREDWDSSLVANAAPGARPQLDFRLTLTIHYELQLVDLATTEVQSVCRLKAKGMAGKRIDRFRAFRKYQLTKEAWFYLKKSMYLLNRMQILAMSKPKIPLIEIADSKGQTAKKLHIVGGSKASFQNGIEFRIVRESKVQVGGADRIRHETLGLASVYNYGHEVAECAVLSGGKEIYEAMQAGAAIFCLFSDTNELPTEWFSSDDQK